jgi:hypothetical protein
MRFSYPNHSQGKRNEAWGKRWLSAWALLAVLVLAVPEARSDSDQAEEYQVKSAYIYNFAKFVVWPSKPEAKAAATLTMGVIGRSPISKSLASFVGKGLRGRRIVVTSIKRLEELDSCDLLFVSVSEKGRLHEILAAVGTRPILTVSDIKRFVAAGGMIGFVPVGEKVRFEINQRAALSSNLHLNAQLLKLATEVLE